MAHGLQKTREKVVIPYFVPERLRKIEIFDKRLGPEGLSMGSKSAHVLKRVNVLIFQGEEFDFTQRYDYLAVLGWIEKVRETLTGFDYEHNQFRLYCVDSYLTPSDKVRHCLYLLRQLLHRLEQVP